MSRHAEIIIRSLPGDLCIYKCSFMRLLSAFKVHIRTERNHAIAEVRISISILHLSDSTYKDLCGKTINSMHISIFITWNLLSE